MTKNKAINIVGIVVPPLINPKRCCRADRPFCPPSNVVTADVWTPRIVEPSQCVCIPNDAVESSGLVK